MPYKNIEDRRAASRRHYASHRELVKGKTRAWRENNPDKAQTPLERSMYNTIHRAQKQLERSEARAAAYYVSDDHSTTATITTRITTIQSGSLAVPQASATDWQSFTHASLPPS